MSGPRPFHNLALIGFMGVGKSAAGRFAARALRYDFVDTDELIEQRAGRRIAEIFAEQGEAAFRGMERALVAEMQDWRCKVISTGTAQVCRSDRRRSARRARAVRRISDGGEHRGAPDGAPLGGGLPRPGSNGVARPCWRKW